MISSYRWSTEEVGVQGSLVLRWSGLNPSIHLREIWQVQKTKKNAGEIDKYIMQTLKMYNYELKKLKSSKY